MDCENFLRNGARCLVRIVGSLTLLTAAATAHGDVTMSDAEWSLLPDYCHRANFVASNHAREGDLQENYRQLGNTAGHIHHYCWAQIQYMQSLQPHRSAGERFWARKNTVDNIDYVLKLAPADFPLLAELWTLRGKAFLGLQDGREAEKSFENAIKADPRHWRAYLQLSLYLNQTGRKKDALKRAEEGLEKNPEAASLRKLTEELRTHE